MTREVPRLIAVRRGSEAARPRRLAAPRFLRSACRQRVARAGPRDTSFQRVGARLERSHIMRPGSASIPDDGSACIGRELRREGASGCGHFAGNLGRLALPPTHRRYRSFHPDAATVAGSPTGDLASVPGQLGSRDHVAAAWLLRRRCDRPGSSSRFVKALPDAWTLSARRRAPVGRARRLA